MSVEIVVLLWLWRVNRPSSCRRTVLSRSHRSLSCCSLVDVLRPAATQSHRDDAQRACVEPRRTRRLWRQRGRPSSWLHDDTWHHEDLVCRHRSSGNHHISEPITSTPSQQPCHWWTSSFNNRSEDESLGISSTGFYRVKKNKTLKK